MPTWTKSPPDDPRGYGLPILRTPAARSLNALVTSDDLIGCDTHFWGGHTMPCERPDCEACNAGIAYRWHGYLAAFHPEDKLHFIFEMTAQASQKFLEYRKNAQTLRGCRFEAYRWRHYKNGRVIIRIHDGPIASYALPPAPELTKIMAVIWRLPIPQVWTDGVERGATKIKFAPEGNGESSDPKLYEQPQP